MTDQGPEILVNENQRRAEQSALLNVRGALDEIGKQEKKERDFRRGVFWVAGALVVLLVAFLLNLAFKPAPPQGPALRMDMQQPAGKEAVTK